MCTVLAGFRDLVEPARRGGLHELASEPTRELHALAVDGTSRTLQQLERVRRLAELDTDLFGDRIGVVLDRREAFLAHHLDRRVPGR